MILVGARPAHAGSAGDKESPMLCAEEGEVIGTARLKAVVIVDAEIERLPGTFAGISDYTARVLWHNNRMTATNRIYTQQFEANIRPQLTSHLTLIAKSRGLRRLSQHIGYSYSTIHSVYVGRRRPSPVLVNQILVYQLM